MIEMIESKHVEMLPSDYTYNLKRKSQSNRKPTGFYILPAYNDLYLLLQTR